ncbi:MAG: hypothetical protein LAO06_13650 [Acidobacteriia bacterium]|nr:hypothetical protein [Terriglobia bacterium]
MRGRYIALLEATPEGLKMIGTPGWRMGEVMGVLVEEGGRQVFRAKSETVEATPERLEELRRFRGELDLLLLRGIAKGLGLPENVERDPGRELE